MQHGPESVGDETCTHAGPSLHCGPHRCVPSLPAFTDGAAVLLIALGGTFVVLSVCSLYYYTARLPAKGSAVGGGGAPAVPVPVLEVVTAEDGGDQQRLVKEGSSINSSSDAAAGGAGAAPAGGPKGFCAQVTEVRQAVYEGFLVFARNKRVGWRLVFLALETAFEDAMVALVGRHSLRLLVPALRVLNSPVAVGLMVTGSAGAGSRRIRQRQRRQVLGQSCAIT